MAFQSRINGYIEIERAAANIYRVFARLFPEEKEFWEELFKDELNHSSFLSGARTLGVFEGLEEAVNPPSMPVVKKTLEFLRNLSRQIRTGPVSREDAFHMALKIEETMVEVFMNELIADVNTDDSRSYFTDFEKILLEERGHLSKIKNMMIEKGLLYES